MENLGNSCFLASVIQLLSNAPLFRFSLLHNRAIYNKLLVKVFAPQKQSVSAVSIELTILIHFLWQGGFKRLSPIALKVQILIQFYFKCL